MVDANIPISSLMFRSHNMPCVVEHTSADGNELSAHECIHAFVTVDTHGSGLTRHLLLEQLHSI